MSKILFTPGPGNTSLRVRAAMGCDIGTRTPQMIELTQNVRQQIATVANCGDDFCVVPLQGSGTFAVEAMLTTLLPGVGTCLILSNGPYGERMATICQIYGLSHYLLRSDPLAPINMDVVAEFITEHHDITSVAMVHFETGVGLLNPLPALLTLAARRGLQVFTDSMSAFGLLPVDFTSPALTAVAASSNKILHGPPGIAFVIARRNMLAQPAAPRTLSLDLRAQFNGFQRDGMWRFTPPVQVIAALACAIDEYNQQGGRVGRLQRYRQMAACIVSGLAAYQVMPLIAIDHDAPVISTFVLPFSEAVLNAHSLSERLLAQDLVIYPSQMTEVNSFRIGFIGELRPEDGQRLVAAITGAIQEVRDDAQ
ncbi:2-aminoethylphosphonate--pyruvate transaminase [Salmonella enterica]